MSDQSRYKHFYNGLGCSAPVAGWSRGKERCARVFDDKVRISEATPPKSSDKISRTAKNQQGLKIAAE